MKNKLSFTLMLVCIIFTTKAALSAEISGLNNYKLDDSAVEQMFETSDDVTFSQAVLGFSSTSDQKVKGENTQMIAGIVALASFITGVGVLVPIHRLILGTDNQAAKIIALYCVTISGCGFLLLVDGILLLMDSSGDKYIENSKFLMWR
jgi:hypothetical protein